MVAAAAAKHRAMKAIHIAGKSVVFVRDGERVVEVMSFDTAAESLEFIKSESIKTEDIPITDDLSAEER